MDEDEEVELKEGMPVENEAGEALGKLGGLLVAEDEEEAEFLVLAADGAERLIPFEAVLGVGDGNLVLDTPRAALVKYPKMKGGADPTEAEMELAYTVYDEHAQHADDDEE
jgi:hypothetical protein